MTSTDTRPVASRRTIVAALAAAVLALAGCAVPGADSAPGIATDYAGVTRTHTDVDPRYDTMCTELFGPILTVHVYDDADLDDALSTCATGSEYALTGAVFAQDRQARRLAGRHGHWGSRLWRDLLRWPWRHWIHGGHTGGCGLRLRLRR